MQQEHLEALVETHLAEDKVMHRIFEQKLDKLEKSVRKWGMLGGVLGGLLAGGVHLLEGCGGAVSRPSETAIAVYAAEQGACVAEFSVRDAVDACRRASRARWCAQWPNEVNCVPNADGGE